MPAATRESDDRILSMLRDRTKGLTPQEIAKRIGIKVKTVLTATNRIRRDDITQSGDPRCEVEAGYWR